MMKVVAIVPAGGSGVRLGMRTKKPFVSLAGKPLLYYALKALESSTAVDEIIIAAEKSQINRVKGLVGRFGFRKVKKVVFGGKTRSGSVKNCLDAITGDPKIVLIHDAARPFLSAGIINKSIKMASKYGGCVVAVPESDTIKLVGRDGFIKKTVDRSMLFRAQTPQVFKADLLRRAYARFGAGNKVTDDSLLLESLGAKVRILPGSSRNMKITTREDIKIAEALL